MKLIAEFSISGLPATINAIGRKHWAFKVKEARQWKRLVVEQCVLARVFGVKLEKAILEFTRHSSQELDFDNLAGSFKHVLDGLVEAGVIIDDKPSIIGSPTFIWQKTKPGEGKVTVKVFQPDPGSSDRAE